MHNYRKKIGFEHKLSLSRRAARLACGNKGGLGPLLYDQQTTRMLKTPQSEAALN